MEISESLTKRRKSLKATKINLKELESEKANANASLLQLRQELSHVCQVHDEVWGNGHSAGLARLKDYLLSNSRSGAMIIPCKQHEKTK